ncbi:MAG: hypothetical protein PHV59_00365 [Victivallales bacterium]|nr:hypothetical protein [Victivallales bacterium]
MSKLWFTPAGKLVLCDNGKIALTDECPCGCPPFEGRQIVYVDKHASGTGDGSSWENAYTELSYTVIYNNRRKEIQIRGYGEDDCYPCIKYMYECTYLHGIDDGNGAVWFDGNIGGDSSRVVIRGVENNLANYRYDNINAKNGSVGFHYGGILNNCTVKNCASSGFFACKTLEDCIAYECVSHTARGFNCCYYAHNCESYSNDFGFIWSYSAGDFSIFTNCLAHNNNYCGYYVSTSGSPAPTLIDCIEYDNCLLGKCSNLLNECLSV